MLELDLDFFEGRSDASIFCSRISEHDATNTTRSINTFMHDGGSRAICAGGHHSVTRENKQSRIL